MLPLNSVFDEGVEVWRVTGNNQLKGLSNKRKAVEPGRRTSLHFGLLHLFTVQPVSKKYDNHSYSTDSSLSTLMLCFVSS
jgi:hypothetical protein